MEDDLFFIDKILTVASHVFNINELQLLKESIDRLINETNYTLEIDNADSFYHSMCDLDYVKVPRVSKKMSNDKMIVLECINGIKITDTKALDTCGIERTEICKKLIKSYIHQIIKKGFFHADPHPGNISIDETGNLIFYDFGLMVEVKSELKPILAQLLVHVCNKEVKDIVSLSIHSGLIIPTTNVEYIEQFFEILLTYFDHANIDKLYDELWNSQLYKNNNGELPFKLPIEIYYIIKTFVTIEGICVTLDPEFTYASYLNEMTHELVKDNVTIKNITEQFLQMPIQITTLTKNVYDIQRNNSSLTNTLNKTQSKIQRLEYILLYFGILLFQHFN